jgi:ribose transport system substrate-binding protein
LNREADYVGELRKLFQVPVFAITSNHVEVGRIQGQQLSTLVPGGGIVLYIHGPAESLAAKQRYRGLLETKLETLDLRVLKAQWSQASAFKGVRSWLQLSTSHQIQIQAVCAQDDSLAMGARRAFEECRGSEETWRRIPFLGCDGLIKTGQDWVGRNLLTATVCIPANAGFAVEMMAKSIHSGALPLELTYTVVKPFPSYEKLGQQPARAATTAR